MVLIKIVDFIIEKYGRLHITVNVKFNLAGLVRVFLSEFLAVLVVPHNQFKILIAETLHVEADAEEGEAQ